METGRFVSRYVMCLVWRDARRPADLFADGNAYMLSASA